MIPLSSRRYCQLTAFENLGIIVSRSGKYQVVSVHDVSHITTFKKGKFESETKIKKIKETKGCEFYAIGD